MEKENPIIEGMPAAEFLRDRPTTEVPLIVMGDAPGHWKELERALDVLPIDPNPKEFTGLASRYTSPSWPEIWGVDIMAINAAGKGNRTIMDVKGIYIKYVATLHSAHFGMEGYSYPANVIPEGAEVHGLNVNGVESEYIDHVWRIEPAGGTSALFGVVVGLILGYRRIMTVGVHLNTPKYWDEYVDKRWRLDWYEIFKPYVRGWSGLVREIYGNEF